jgi:hypothetical protein
VATTSGQFTVSTSATALTTAETDTVGGVVLFVRNANAAAADTVALGGSGVTAATGLLLPGGSIIGPFEIPSGEQLYAIRGTAADVAVHVLRLGA